MILKSNPTEKTHFIAYKSDRANKDTHRSRTGFVKSNLPKGAVSAPSYTTLADPGTYRTGMGETKQLQRPGSDLSHIKSVGF